MEFMASRISWICVSEGVGSSRFHVIPALSLNVVPVEKHFCYAVRNIPSQPFLYASSSPRTVFILSNYLDEMTWNPQKIWDIMYTFSASPLFLVIKYSNCTRRDKM